jgi:hypothetical protein
MKVVIIVLILIIVYYVFTNFNLGCNDSFLQPQPKTGPEIQSTLDVEGKIALFNKMQETYFKA